MPPVRLDRNNPASFCGRGLCLRKLGRPRDARSGFDTAIDLAEGHAESTAFTVAFYLQVHQQWAEAAEDFAAAAKAGVRYAYRATMNRIDCLWRGGLVSEALEALEAAQRHFPALPGAPSVASVLLLQLGRPQESVRQCWGEVMIFMMSQVASRHAQLVAAATALSRLQALSGYPQPRRPTGYSCSGCVDLCLRPAQPPRRGPVAARPGAWPGSSVCCCSGQMSTPRPPSFVRLRRRRFAGPGRSWHWGSSRARCA